MRRVLVACGVAFVAGVVASLAAGGSGSVSAGRWVIRDLGTLGGNASSAVDINARGEVVGWRYTVRTRVAMPSRHAFLWSQGKMRDLGTLPLGGRGDIPKRERGDGAQRSRPGHRDELARANRVDPARLRVV